jgi:DNA-binding LacI/PurR family transcriptional regulator
MNSDRPRRRPSMADVGRAAQVSAQTVSRFYTGGYVSPDTKSAIERAVRELGYQRSRLPSILRAERTDTIGFLSMGPLNYGNSGILTGISRAARAEGQALITTQLDLDPSAPDSRAEILHALENFLSMRVDGIVVGTPYIGLGAVIEMLGKSVEVVSLSEAVSEGVDSVHADSYGAARMAVEHLVSLGHRRILHLAGPGNRNEADARVRGYQDVLADAGLEPMPLVRCAEWDAVSGAEAAGEVVDASFTAVFSANDEIALGFISALRDRGLEAPRDYSIVGVDDMPESQFFTPPLTSARLDFEQLGETALRMVLDRVRDTSEHPRTIIPATLSIRASTAPVIEP